MHILDAHYIPATQFVVCTWHEGCRARRVYAAVDGESPVFSALWGEDIPCLVFQAMWEAICRYFDREEA